MIAIGIHKISHVLTTRDSQVGEQKYISSRLTQMLRSKLSQCNFDFKLEKREKPGALNAESSL